MNLAWKLAGVVNSTLGPEGSGHLRAGRKPHARKMIGLALMVGRAMTAGGRIGDLARRTIVPRMHLLPGLRERVIDSQTPALNRPSWYTGPTYPVNSRAIVLTPSCATGDGSTTTSATGSPSSSTAVGSDRAVPLAESRGAVVHIAEPGGELDNGCAARGAHMRPSSVRITRC